MATDRRRQRESQEAAGEWLRRTRERRGFATMGALARRMKVSESLISRYETGISGVPDDKADRIAAALGLDIITVRRNLGLWVPPDAPPADDEPDMIHAADLDGKSREEVIDLLLDAMEEGWRVQREMIQVIRKTAPQADDTQDDN